jgi:two-component system nitrogen regulation response regulator NtrX
LFLDEVDALPMDTQTKFLRAIEDRMFEAVGSEETQRLDARLIAATNKELEPEVDKGRFRSDLYYRLNVASFRLPPLRERGDEIGLLVEHFESTLALEHGLGRPRFSPLAANALRRYDWPGNIRELRNAIEHCLIMSSGTEVELKHLPERLQRSVPQPELKTSAKSKTEAISLKEVKRCAERDHLVAELLRHDNNRSRTAEKLGISRAALYKQLEKHNLK